MNISPPEDEIPRAHIIVIGCLGVMILFTCLCYYCCIYKCPYNDDDDDEEEDEEEKERPVRQSQVASFTETVAAVSLAATSCGAMEMPIGTALAACGAEAATSRLPRRAIVQPHCYQCGLKMPESSV